MTKKLIAFFVLVSVFASCFGRVCAEAKDDNVNVALYQMAISSSDYSINNNASCANDGIIDNVDYSYWMSAEGDVNAWWQVDLGLPYEIDRVVIVPRIEACESERENIRIVAYAESIEDTPVELINISSDGYGDKLTLEVSKKARYRYIRVEKTDSQKISIGEIQVLVDKKAIPQGTDFENRSRQIPLKKVSDRYEIPNDVKGTPYEKAVSLLYAIDIMHGYPDGLFLPDETISRAEFTLLAVRLMKSYEETDTGYFTDVPFGFWAYHQIEYAAQHGIINGVGNMLFMPDDEVNLNQAVKIIVSLLGYSDVARDEGGYPGGYINIAEQLGLLNGINKSGEITRGEIAILICNALKCNLYSSGNTLLSDVFNIEHRFAQVTEAGDLSLVSSDYIRQNGKITLGDMVYSTDIPEPERYIGLNTEYYYEISNPDKIIALIQHESDKVIEFDVSQIIEANDIGISYMDDGGLLQRLLFEDNMKLIYDGRIISDDKSTYILPDSGKIKCIDNGNDHNINVYMVYPERKYSGADYLEAFSEEMNKKALELGMNNSHFNDPAGLKNFSTPGDLVKCLMEAYRYDSIREIWSKDSHSFAVEGENPRNVEMNFSLVTKGSNAVSSAYDVLGGKGGNLNTPVIYNMAAIVKVPDSEDSISAVIMGSESLEEMYTALKQTIDAAVIKYKDKNADVSNTEVSSKSAIACVTSQSSADEEIVLFEKYSNLQDMTASTAKMMTAILVNQYISDLSTKICVTAEDISLLPSGFYANDYKAGDVLTVSDALHALLYKSSNSSAFFLGRMIGEIIVNGK